MAQRIGEHAEADSGHLLRRLHDAPAERLGPAKRGGDILDADEKQHLVTGALQRTDRRRRPPSAPEATNV